MNKIKIICSDLDGTLLDDEKRLSTKNILAIKKWQENDNYFGIVSGRQISGLERIYKNEFEPDFLVGLNGGYVLTINGKTIFNDFSDDHLYKVIERLKELDISQITVTKLGRSKEISINNFENGQIEKISVVVKNNQTADDLIKKLNDLPVNVTQSDYCYVEISERNISKLSGIIMAVGNENLDKTAAIGDFNNDIEMIESAGLGVAMGNALSEVKKYADVIVADNKNDGVADLINKLLANQEKNNDKITIHS